MLSSSMLKLRCPKGDEVLVGCDDGSLIELSMKYGKEVCNFGQIFDGDVSSMASIINKETLFVCDWDGNFREFTTRTNKFTNHFGITNANHCLVTDDNEFLITSESGQNSNLSKWSMQTNQLVSTWKSNVDESVCS